ncbi:MAG: methylated-DNA--[protein]-cysteine S-methyltransferase [Anaerolineales bacterium]|nr:methylated-DNA--[protein]-cysteine S-methyltransferase [Anaerolineales bacterium]
MLAESTQPQTDYNRIAQAIAYLEQHFPTQPNLKEVADHVGLSEYHFQRLFTRWAGISPKKFAQFLTIGYAKGLLAEANSNLLDVTLETGLSSPGRLHDLFITYEAMTPGQYKQQGNGLDIRYGVHPSPFGPCLLALTERGICGLHFLDDGGTENALAELYQRWPQATFVADSATTRPLVAQIFDPQRTAPLHLQLQGTNFQVRVWEALLQIPAGRVVSYDLVAEMMGEKTAVRAVASAVARNPIGYLIPCHRVIRKTGAFGQYHWGETRKKAILAWEAAQR